MTTKKSEVDPRVRSYVETLSSPRAELMVKDLIEEYLLRKCPSDTSLEAFNGKRELVIDILTLAKLPLAEIIINTEE